MARSAIPVVREETVQLSRLANDYIKYIAAYKGYSPRTAESYELTYGQFRASLQLQGLPDDVKHFNSDTVAAFAVQLAAGGCKPNSVNTKLAALGSLAKYGIRTKDPKGRYVLAENPLARIERPQRQKSNRKFLHRDELKAFLTVECPANERVAIDLFMDTGLRVSELVRANVRDLWQDGQERLVLSVTVKGRGRRAEKVDVPLGAAAGEKLTAFLAHREARPEDPLIVNQAGNRYTRTGLSQRIYELAKRAGIIRMPVRAHALRHTYNVVARVEAKLDGPQRAGLLNQTDTASVTKYDHLLPDETIEARDAVRAGMRRYAGV